MWEHKNDILEGFTSRYHIHRLVYFERYSDIRSAIDREKQVKRWSRKKKLTLIESLNPDWLDLSQGWPENADPSAHTQSLALPRARSGWHCEVFLSQLYKDCHPDRARLTRRGRSTSGGICIHPPTPVDFPPSLP